MQRILVPVDGSASSNHAVEHVVGRAKTEGPAEVHLLHVEPGVETRAVDTVALTGLAGPLQRTEAEKATKSAQELLGEGGVQHTLHFESGDTAETIARYAKVHGCDEIVMGTRGMGTLRNLLLGSVATKVVNLVDMPVTLVR